MNKALTSIILFISSTGSAATAPDLPAFAKVTEAVYRGGRPTEQGLHALKDLGIKTDIDLQGGDLAFSDPYVLEFMRWWEPGETAENIASEKNLVENVLQFNFIPAPLSSLLPVTTEEDSQIDGILNILNDPLAQPVFIHCEHGKDRTGLIIALYQVKFQNKSIADAYAEWAKSGHSGVGAYFTSELDKYYYRKAKQIVGL